MADKIQVDVPSIGGAEDVVVAEVLVAVGDQVEAEQSLVTLESDKASMEVPAPAAGTVASLQVEAGQSVNEGDLLLELEGAVEADGAGAGDPSGDEAKESDRGAHAASSVDDAEGAADDQPSPAFEPDDRAPAPPPAVTSVSGATPPRHAAELPYASPAVRKLARERGVELTGVSGTGRNGRITADDVEKAASGAATAAGGAIPPMPAVDFSQFGEIEHERLTRINQLTGENVHRSWLHVPHVTQFDEADITELEAFRKAKKAAAEDQGFKLTFVSFLLAACAAALREFPRFNSSLSADGSAVILKKYINIGVAVDTPRGLVVPVVRGVDEMRLFDIAEALVDISTRAREGKLTPADFQGGTFTISSLGGIGGTAFTPIVNAPEVAILGVSRSRMQPVWNGSEFEPRLMLPLSLSYDHRVIDGAAAARFTTRLSALLSDIRELLL